MSKLSLTFADLTDEEHDYLIQAWRTIRERGLKVDAHEHHEHTVGGYTLQSQTEYEAAQAHVEQRPAVQIPQPALNAAIEIDATGVPWNSALHASTKTKTKRGEWQLRKGVDKDAAEKWRQQHATGRPAPAAQPAPAAEVNQAAAAAFGMLPAPVTVAPTYNQWYAVFQQTYMSGKLTESAINSINAAAGVENAALYEHNERARAISLPMLQQLLAA